MELLLPLAVLLVALAIVFPRAGQLLAIGAAVLAGVVVIWTLIHGVSL